MRSFLGILGFTLLASCGGDGLYAACETADDCTDVPEGADAECLESGGEAVCTWQCESDEDCAGDESWARLCAPFESSSGSWCFPSCEDEDVEDPDAPCPEGYTCRSTGGGTDNKKVCFPGE